MKIEIYEFNNHKKFQQICGLNFNSFNYTFNFLINLSSHSDVTHILICILYALASFAHEIVILRPVFDHNFLLVGYILMLFKAYGLKESAKQHARLNKCNLLGNIL